MNIHVVPCLRVLVTHGGGLEKDLQAELVAWHELARGGHLREEAPVAHLQPSNPI